MDYINDANKTKSDKFFGELVSASHVQAVVTGCIAYLQELDKIKKALYYGREFEHPRDDGETVESTQMFAALGGNQAQDIDVVHAIIGKATEAGELLEALKAAVDSGQPLDRTNLMEELGDGQWYDAVLAQALGFTFEEVQKINIDKLRSRYPEKFTVEKAENRDLTSERKVLEDGKGGTPWEGTVPVAPPAPTTPKAKK